MSNRAKKTENVPNIGTVKAYDMGYDHFLMNGAHDKAMNPFEPGSEAYDNWGRGYDDAEANAISDGTPDSSADDDDFFSDLICP